jgi:hypothetical protein
MRTPARWLALVPTLLLPLTATPSGAAPETAKEIQKCVEDNMPEESSQQTVVFRAEDRVGSITESKATIYWRRFPNGRSRVLIRFASPEDLRGASVLLLERSADARDIFMYLPALREVKRITSRMMSGSMFGTDFTYEEFERIQDYAATAEAARLPDRDVEGSPAWVLESRPAKGEVSDYTRIVDFIDPRTCVRLRTEMYQNEDEPRKVATVDRSKLTEQKGVWFAPAIVMRDLRNETQTTLEIEEVEVGAHLPESLFSQATLGKGR